ncbi:Gfo/Idh/MocA family protein [Lutibaculum baratangense]|nr:Gfo/Idh/MocA family oxidoreductase [Lutibaculum baratangense]
MAITGRDEKHLGRIRLGMVGGGQGAFIGGVHRVASRLDDHYTLVAGAFSSDPERAKASGRELGLPEERCYGSFEEMAKREKRLKDGIEAVSVVTPNHMHFPVAREFLKRGIHVICDKPLTTNLRDAKRLKDAAEKSGATFAVTYNYTGYPMVRQARAMVEAGEIGEIRLVQVEYPQDWLTEEVHNKQADWRTDPEMAGAGGCVGDIGTHAYHMACFVSGLQAESIAAELSTFVEGRRLDDNVQVMLRFTNGARGMLWASQVAVGNENGLRFRIYGTKGGLEWEQENPNWLWHAPFGEPKRRITRGGAGAGDAAGRVSRIPAGHPEGYLEGFANIYSEVAQAILAARDGGKVDAAVSFPRIDDGVKGVAFIEACVKSSGRNAGWVSL